MSTMHWARNRTLCAVHLHSVPGTSFDGHPRQIKCIAFYFTLADNPLVPPVDYLIVLALKHMDRGRNVRLNKSWLRKF